MECYTKLIKNFMNENQRQEYNKEYQHKAYYETKDAKKKAKERRQRYKISFSLTTQEFIDCVEKCRREDNATEDI